MAKSRATNTEAEKKSPVDPRIEAAAALTAAQLEHERACQARADQSEALRRRVRETEDAVADAQRAFKVANDAAEAAIQNASADSARALADAKRTLAGAEEARFRAEQASVEASRKLRHAQTDVEALIGSGRLRKGEGNNPVLVSKTDLEAKDTLDALAELTTGVDAAKRAKERAENNVEAAKADVAEKEQAAVLSGLSVINGAEDEGS